MSAAYLGEVFDIHGGGIDLVFPHHENEVAQSRCCFGTETMANYWMHNGFLQVEGEKMAKSAGNFVTIRELLEDWPGEVIRLTMLKTHYRQPIDWTLRSVNESKRELETWASLIDAAGARGYLASEQHHEDARLPSSGVLEAVSDDLNSPGVLAVLREEAKAAKGNKAKAAKFLTSLKFLGLVRSERLHVFEAGLASIGQLEWPPSAIEHANRLRAAYANDDAQRVEILKAGLEAKVPGSTVELRESGALTLHPKGEDASQRIERIEAFIEQRRAARAAKDWAGSDRIRDELAAMGIALKDNKDGTTTWEVAR
jgi:cysteinyl-tRNA synthetase